ncbi:Response regulator containing a CheY-like receiver domain and an HTH DNA-binding domain protein [Legionella gratiana]|uniref:Response regulator containing a CheY-like receiver domain and an HTH DNA-binding domain n=1 Tax=Legionella gratiana TaxID=45066 RepID=A0A378JD84_9GAMM|nr:helix-turn-helix transcriptional regulator [Legionella gratiana]KTD05507.1 Response regulator containing a CheY-like receiver domain and an HTH DNA-binding domain protein [Legionella gratiana]STX45409.1 Response regulator containing a CheY-like receiver domain and an HTH DNA-binding domain [Legionella gratiana]
MRQDDAIKQMISLSEGLTDLCYPLQELGIHLFNVLINYDDNRQIYLCNNPQWVCDYYLYELHQCSLYDNKPSLFQYDEYTLWPEHLDQPILKHGLDYYDNRYGVTICHRRDAYSAFYFFAGSHTCHYLPHFFINNFSFLDRFINCFWNRKQSLINEAYAVGLQRHKKRKDSPWGEEAILLSLQQQQTLQTKRKLMEEQHFSLGPTLNSPLFSNLSRRQKQVLYGLTRGESAQEMAERLHISRRTVERHLYLLKTKYPNYSYIELILELLSAKPKEILLTHTNS